jgi:Fe2+ or Zn2+ uptake regulation protein
MPADPLVTSDPAVGADESLGSVEVSLSPMARFEEYLQSKGMRSTEQRRLLVEHVFSRHEHFDADALIEQLPRKTEQGYVSRPTVYRTLGSSSMRGCFENSSSTAARSTSTTTAIPSTTICIAASARS